MSAVAYHEGEWNASRQRLHYRFWMPQAPNALLVVIHGFGEHGGRYVPFAEALAGQDIAVGIPDLLGHGLSSGTRGDVRDLRDCVAQLESLTADVFVAQSRQTAYALFGHSFGGLVAIRWALGEPKGLTRVVIQSPLLEVGFPLPRMKAVGATVLSAVWPSFTIAMDLDVAALSHDQAVVQAYRTDPLVHNCMTAGTYREIVTVRDQVMAQADRLRIPTLLLCGAADRIISVPTAQRWYEQLRCVKRCCIFPGAYHELHHEPIQHQVIRLMTGWVRGDGANSTTAVGTS